MSGHQVRSKQGPYRKQALASAEGHSLQLARFRERGMAGVEDELSSLVHGVMVGTLRRD